MGSMAAATFARDPCTSCKKRQKGILRLETMQSSSSTSIHTLDIGTKGRGGIPIYIGVCIISALFATYEPLLKLGLLGTFHVVECVFADRETLVDGDALVP